MTFSIRVVLRKYKPNNVGNHMLQLCVTKNSIRKRISLKLWVNPEYWDNVGERLIVERNLKGEKQKEANRERIAINTLLDKYKARARQVIEKFEIEGIDWTLNQFEDAYLNTSKQGKFNAYLTNHIETLRRTGHEGNSRCYFETQRLLKYYDKKLEQRLFSDIDLRYVRGFDGFLQQRGCVGNTRKYYFKALRAILNKAIKEGEGAESTYPFGKGGFEISRLEEVTEKRYLSKSDLQKIKMSRSQKPQCEYARKLFLFSYYCFGMSFVDMAQLTNSNIQRINDAEYIVYKRQKIRTQRNTATIKVKINDEIRALMDELRLLSPVVDDYILPIVTRSGYSNGQLYAHIRGRYGKYRQYLLDLAKELNIDAHLTSYVSRHTAAMILQRSNIPREVISQMLGHTDLETTNVYLDSFDNDVIDKAAQVL